MADYEKIIWNGQGPVYLGTFDAINGKAASGYLTKIYAVGCGTSTLTVSPTVEKKELKESCSGQRMTLAEIETSKSLAVTLEMFQFDVRTLATAYYGDVVDNEGSSVTDEELPSDLKAGDIFVTEYPDISSVTVSVGSSALTEDTDYEIVDAKGGVLKMLTTPTVGTNEKITIDYTYADSSTVPAFSATTKEMGLIFNGINTAGQHVRVIIPRVRFGLNGDFPLLSDEEATLSLSGNAMYVSELADDTTRKDTWGAFMRIDVISAATDEDDDDSDDTNG